MSISLKLCLYFLKTMSLLKKNNRCNHYKINSYSDSKKCPIKSIYKSTI